MTFSSNTFTGQYGAIALFLNESALYQSLVIAENGLMSQECAVLPQHMFHCYSSELIALCQLNCSTVKIRYKIGWILQIFTQSCMYVHVLHVHLHKLFCVHISFPLRLCVMQALSSGVDLPLSDLFKESIV